MKPASVAVAMLAGLLLLAGSTSAARTQQGTLSIGDALGPEGNADTRPLAFRVTLSEVSRNPVLVRYRTQNETARGSEDYVATQGLLRFTEGETTKTIEVTINGDRAVEPDEFFSVILSDPVGATIAQPGGVGTGTIQNDDRNVGLRACKCLGLKLQLGGFVAHGTTTLRGEAAEFWDVLVKAKLTCRQGDVVDCAGFVKTVSPSTSSPFATQKPKVFTCKGRKCGATSTHPLRVRVRVPRAEILRQHAVGRPLKKAPKLRAGCRGAPGVVRTFKLALPTRN